MKEQRLRRVVLAKPLWLWLLLLLPLATTGAAATATATTAFKRPSLCCRPATVLRGGTSNSPTVYYESPPSFAVQNRIDQWRSVQQVEQSERNAELATVAPGRREVAPTAGWYITFILIVVRSGYLLVLARDEEQNLGDHVFSFLLFLPLLIIANLFGVVIVALLGPSLTPTKMFKGVLNLEKDVNLLWIVYSIFRFAVFPTPLMTREAHIWNVVAAAFFLWQATRLPSRFYHETGRIVKEHSLLRIVLHRLLEVSLLFLATAVAASRISTWADKQRCRCWRSAMLLRGGTSSSDIPIPAGEEVKDSPIASTDGRDSSLLRKNGSPPDRAHSTLPPHGATTDTGRNLESTRAAAGRLQFAQGFICAYVFVRNLSLLDLGMFEIRKGALPYFTQQVLALPLYALTHINLSQVVSAAVSPSQTTAGKFEDVWTAWNTEKIVNQLWITYSVLRLTVCPTPFVPRQMHVCHVVVAALSLWLGHFFTRDERLRRSLRTMTTGLLDWIDD